MGATLAMALFSCSFSTVRAQPAAAAPASAAPESPFTYADVADLATRADIIAVARPRSFAKVPAEAAGMPPGTQRFYVDAQVDSLIRGDAGLPPRIAFLLDLPATEKPGRTLKGKSIILFGRAGARPGEFQLLSSKAMLPSSPGTDARVRRITTELLAPEAPPEIARVVEAFHVEGTVAGESETQIFLTTRGGRPISLSIVRRPDMEPRFGAALGEIVDEAADLPTPDSLLWYRLACGLPPALPQSAAMKLDAVSAPAAAADYRAFMERLAPCERTRPPVLGKQEIGG
ncbi:MAG: hypothetical protein QM690_16445 [Sphingobium sp.]